MRGCGTGDGTRWATRTDKRTDGQADRQMGARCHETGQLRSHVPYTAEFISYLELWQIIAVDTARLSEARECRKIVVDFTLRHFTSQFRKKARMKMNKSTGLEQERFVILQRAESKSSMMERVIAGV